MSHYLFHHLTALSKFRNSEDLAIITDVDGTISEIAPTPEEAEVSDSMNKLLTALNKKFKLVGVISGRSLSNVKDMVGVDGILYVGNHGLEYLKNGEKFIETEAEKYCQKMEELYKEIEKHHISKLEGLILENKKIGLCIHYRQCPSSEEAREKIRLALKEILNSDELKISSGRKIIEIKPPLIQDKGTILEKIAQEYNLKQIIYLGDDVTDYDAFTKLEELEKKKNIETASILVLSKEIPIYVKNSAKYYLNSVQEVQRFFEWLLYK